jgi:hypothetical protein
VVGGSNGGKAIELGGSELGGSPGGSLLFSFTIFIKTK